MRHFGYSEISKLSGFEFVARHENTIVNSELTIFAVILVEFFGRVIIQAFKRKAMNPGPQYPSRITRCGLYHSCYRYCILFVIQSRFGNRYRYRHRCYYCFRHSKPGRKCFCGRLACYRQACESWRRSYRVGIHRTC